VAANQAKVTALRAELETLSAGMQAQFDALNAQREAYDALQVSLAEHTTEVKARQRNLDSAWQSLSGKQAAENTASAALRTQQAQAQQWQAKLDAAKVSEKDASERLVSANGLLTSRKEVLAKHKQDEKAAKLKVEQAEQALQQAKALEAAAANQAASYKGYRVNFNHTYGVLNLMQGGAGNIVPGKALRMKIPPQNLTSKYGFSSANAVSHFQAFARPHVLNTPVVDRYISLMREVQSHAASRKLLTIFDVRQERPRGRRDNGRDRRDKRDRRKRSISFRGKGDSARDRRNRGSSSGRWVTRYSTNWRESNRIHAHFSAVANHAINELTTWKNALITRNTLKQDHQNRIQVRIKAESALRSAKAEKAALTSLIESAQQKVTSAEQAKTQAQQALNSARSNVAKANTQLTSANQAMDRAKASLSSAKAEREAAEQLLSQASTHLSTAQTDKARVASELLAARTTLNQASTQFAKAHQSLRGTAQSLNQAGERLGSAIDLHAEVNASLNQAYRAQYQAKSAIDRAQGQVDIARYTAWRQASVEVASHDTDYEYDARGQLVTERSAVVSFADVQKDKPVTQFIGR
ncbi:hypothetical protein MHN79_20720, partial [Vibrio sp. Of14-4]|uniref:hypothetical protein n=1 Tax=Vibrio sp. Of14-4 TaxID=2724878 RepID=UPI001EF25056